MTFQEVLDALEANRSISVNRELTAGEQKVVREGLAVMRVYQDQPAHIPYPLRPKRYMLIRTDDFHNRRRHGL